MFILTRGLWEFLTNFINKINFTLNKCKTTINNKVGLQHLQIPKREHFERGRGGGGVAYFTCELFVCKRAPLIKCKGENEIASLISGSLISIHHNREISNPLPEYSISIKYSYHQFGAIKINNLELKRSQLHLLWLKILSQHGRCAVH